MRNVVFTALIVVAATTTSWAQTPAPAAPAPPATVAPSARQAAPPAPAAPTTPTRPGPAPLPVVQPAPATVAAVQTPGRYPNPPRNVRFDIVITETGIAKPSTKTVSLTVNDGGGSGSVRNSGKAAGDAAWLNVDVRGVQAFEGGAVRAGVNVEYQPVAAEVPTPAGAIQSSITSMFQDGRRIQILQTADPLSDRRTTIDVTMTVMK